MSQSSIRGRIRDKLVISPTSFGFAFLFSERSNSNSVYAFFHWINNGREKVFQSPLNKAFLRWQTRARLGAHLVLGGFGPSIRCVSTGWFLCCAAAGVVFMAKAKVTIKRNTGSLSLSSSSEQRNVKLDICLRKQSTQHVHALKGGSCPACLSTFGKCFFLNEL